jgi:uncharacterized protein YbjT (DUF2867 family)
MEISSVCILGGTGFVGHAIAEQLSPLGIRTRIVTRSGPKAMSLTVLPTVEAEVADVHDPAALRACFENMDAVINLVGILHESGAQTFQAVHAELPRQVADACRATGVQQLLHMSALGASRDGPSAYLRSKGEGEAALREAAGMVPLTIFRPSVIFGEHDRFLNTFAELARWFPVIPLAGAGAKFQPIWVEDVARCYVGALGNVRVHGEAYELCGPKVYTLAELVEFVAHTLQRKPRVMALPDGLARLQASVLERLPGKLMTRDNLASMSVDNVCSCDFPAFFGFKPSPLEAVVPEYLASSAARGRYSRYRHYAGR